MKTYDDYIKHAQQLTPFSIDESWTQGRSVFGGLSAALVLAHVEANIDYEDKELRSVNVNFCGAIDANVECQLSYQIMSAGKSVLQVQGQLSQNKTIKTLVTFCFGRQRPSSLQVQPTRNCIAEHAFTSMPFLAGIVPNFIQHIKLAFGSEHLPFSGKGDGHVFGQMSFNTRPQVFNDCAILALIDAWPPAVLPMLKSPAPASTITWQVDFIQPTAKLNHDDCLFYDCKVIQAEQGYAHTESQVFHPNGQLIALSRQLVGIYDKA